MAKVERPSLRMIKFLVKPTQVAPSVEQLFIPYSLPDCDMSWPTIVAAAREHAGEHTDFAGSSCERAAGVLL